MVISRKALIPIGLLVLSSYALGGVFKDDFEDGDSKGWKELSGKWIVEEGMYGLSETPPNPPGFVYTVLQSPWELGDGVLEVDVKFTRNTKGSDVAAILFRMPDEVSGYIYRMHGKGWFEFGRLVNNSFKYLIGLPIKLSPGKTYTIKILLEGDIFKVYVNGELFQRMGDPEAKIKKGRIGLGLNTKNILFEEVRVEGEGVFQFSVGEQVEPVDKMPVTWATLKNNREGEP